MVKNRIVKSRRHLVGTALVVRNGTHHYLFEYFTVKLLLQNIKPVFLKRVGKAHQTKLYIYDELNVKLIINCHVKFSVLRTLGITTIGDPNKKLCKFCSIFSFVKCLHTHNINRCCLIALPER